MAQCHKVNILQLEAKLMKNLIPNWVAKVLFWSAVVACVFLDMKIIQVWWYFHKQVWNKMKGEHFCAAFVDNCFWPVEFYWARRRLLVSFKILADSTWESSWPWKWLESKLIMEITKKSIVFWENRDYPIARSLKTPGHLLWNRRSNNQVVKRITIVWRRDCQIVRFFWSIW